MKFVQTIEFKSSKVEEIEKLTEDYVAATEGKRTTVQAWLCKDRDRADTYVEIVVFPSYEQAMENNDLPETQEFAQKMVQLCDGEPVFRNLDLVREEEG